MNNMETFWSTSHVSRRQSSYLESLYESYLDQILSSDDWKIYFDSLPKINGLKKRRIPSRIINQSLKRRGQSSIKHIYYYQASSKQVKVIQLIQAYRNRGHQKAKLDPLGIKPVRHCEDLDLNFHDLDESNLSDIFDTDTLMIGKESATL